VPAAVGAMSAVLRGVRLCLAGLWPVLALSVYLRAREGAQSLRDKSPDAITSGARVREFGSEVEALMNSTTTRRRAGREEGSAPAGRASGQRLRSGQQLAARRPSARWSSPSRLLIDAQMIQSQVRLASRLQARESRCIGGRQGGGAIVNVASPRAIPRWSCAARFAMRRPRRGR